ncbi:HD domain-containing protein [Alteripontixanthobacter muriae]|uniref:HD domain-containing protein n=1 Tax=Alteripontixanthobacter muriae TaxID=2705546 RepID=UPI001E2B8162|nr:HD domain-containing protein [Alteripontixanthobacter muriae]
MTGSVAPPDQGWDMENPSSILTDRFDHALAYASRIHRLQTRKGSQVPYVSHLLGVCAIALENGADEDQAIAALLHDAVEDQGGAERLAEIERIYGPRVARIVAHCTDAETEPKPPWRERKEDYLASLAAKPVESLQVSLADKTHNAGAIVADLQVYGEAVWERFTGGREGSLWYYRALADEFTRQLPGASSRRLSRLVAEMEKLSR